VFGLRVVEHELRALEFDAREDAASLALGYLEVAPNNARCLRITAAAGT